MNYIGIKNYSFLEIEDKRLNKSLDKFLTLKISNYDFIFIPSPMEEHPDHACVYEFLSNLKHQARVFAYEVSSALTEPTHYVNITDVIRKKEKLISFYNSQIVQVDYLSKTIGLNCFRGLLPYPAVSYAEAYQELRHTKK
jgi:LmbE family N-acetylglucosaminyl deacetylase